MSAIFKSNTFTSGFAIFSMFFGAGNVVFPLLLGQKVGEKNSVAVLGLLITAISVPFLGLVSMILFDGDYKTFFYRLGNVPGSFLIIFIMALIGPFVGIPRCITLSYSTFKYSYAQMFASDAINIWAFSLFACFLIFMLSYKRLQILKILGNFLTPFLLACLLVIITLGLINHPTAQNIDWPCTKVFFYGLKEGYNTLDLPAAFFFSTIVLACLRKNYCSTKEKYFRPLVIQTLKSSILAIVLLTSIYAGLSFVSSFYGQNLTYVNNPELLAAIAFKILGKYAGVVASFATALACLTTAITLAAIFAEFIHENMFLKKLRYGFCLFITLCIAFCISLFTFNNIVSFVAPIIFVCYPTFIALCILNILYKLFGFKPVKLPTLLVFLITMVGYLI